MSRCQIAHYIVHCQHFEAGGMIFPLCFVGGCGVGGVWGGLNVELLSEVTTKPVTRNVSLRISIFCSLSFSKGVSVFVYLGLYTHLSFALNVINIKCCTMLQIVWEAQHQNMANIAIIANPEKGPIIHLCYCVYRSTITLCLPAV